MTYYRKTKKSRKRKQVRNRTKRRKLRGGDYNMTLIGREKGIPVLKNGADPIVYKPGGREYLNEM